MSFDSHSFIVDEARRLNHPVFSSVTKYIFTVRCKDLPKGISNSANARDPEKDLNRRVYKDVRQSLRGEMSKPGTFDLMNKGIIIIAESVEMDPNDKRKWIVKVNNEEGGIVDGGHTAKLIWDAQDEDKIPDEQYVDVYIRTGLTPEISPEIISDISKGLNTSLQVKAESILDKKEAFDWMKKELAPDFDDLVKYAESDDGQYYVQDIIGVLECLNIADYPPEGGEKHPTQVATSISKIVEKFGQECKKAKDEKRKGKYELMRPILREAMILFQTIQADFPIVHNKEFGGRAGGLKMVETSRTGEFELHFAGRTVDKKLFKQATYPIFAGFRNCVIEDSNGNLTWNGGFEKVLDVWKKLSPTLVQATIDLGKSIGTTPDQIAKHKPHWNTIFDKVYIHLVKAKSTASLGQSSR